MKPRLPLFLALSLMLFLWACKKNSNTPAPTNTIMGTYDLVSLSANFTSTNQASQGGVTVKTITYSKYTTIDNAGTITITSDSMYTSNMTYTVDTSVMVYEYENAQLIDSFEYPFYYNLPVSSGASRYRLITNDSIYYYAGGIIDMGLSGSSGTTSTQGGGGRYVLSGNVLTLTSHLNQSYIDNSQGFPISVVNKGIETVILQKQ
jgi:hypothetical protein